VRKDLVSDFSRERKVFSTGVARREDLRLPLTEKGKSSFRISLAESVRQVQESQRKMAMRADIDYLVLDSSEAVN